MVETTVQTRPVTIPCICSPFPTLSVSWQPPLQIRSRSTFFFIIGWDWTVTTLRTVTSLLARYYSFGFVMILFINQIVRRRFFFGHGIFFCGHVFFFFFETLLTLVKRVSLSLLVKRVSLSLFFLSLFLFFSLSVSLFLMCVSRPSTGTCDTMTK